MNKAGLGGRTLSLFSSFYNRDNIRFEVGGARTKRMFLKNGLKQVAYWITGGKKVMIKYI